MSNHKSQKVSRREKKSEYWKLDLKIFIKIKKRNELLTYLKI